VSPVKRLTRCGIPAILLALSSFDAAHAAPRDPHFERIGSESGPPFTVVTALLQDSVGFVWIGSRNGLMVYDGHGFTTFEHDPSDPSSLSDDAIRTIFEDRGGNLWVGTNSGGLNRLDRTTWKFHRFRHDSADPRSISHDSVYAIVEDRDGRLWVGTQRGLNRFDPPTGSFERFLADPSKPGSLSHNYVSSLLVDRQGRLWVGTVGGGLDHYDASSGRFDAWRPAQGDPRALGDASVFALLEGEAGQLWVGTNSGLESMDIASGVFRRHTLGEPASPSPLIVSSLASAPGGRIWAGTFGEGLKEFDPRTGAVRSFRHQDGSSASLPANRVLSMMTDRAGALWVGTWGGGLSRVSESALLLASGPDETPEPQGLEDRDVTSLAGDAAGGLWVGIRNGTLLHRPSSASTWRTFPLKGPGSILRILPARSGMVWVGTSQGLARLDPRDGQVVWFKHSADDPSSLGPGFVPALLEDRAGRLWVGTGEGGLNEIDGDGRVLRRFQNAPADPASLSDDYVTALHEDGHGVLWVGTRSGGVNAIDPGTGRAERHSPDPADPRSLSHHNVTAIFEDSKGRLWIATGGGGINRVDRGTAGEPIRFTRFTAADGLVNNNVMAVLEDDDGTLWLSTKRGLARYSPESGTFTNFDVTDGLPSSEFEFGAAVRAGRSLLFGSVAWVAAVPAGTPLPTPFPSPTVITSVRGESDELRGDRPPWALERLEVPYGTWFSIEVAVLDFNTQHNHAHMYRMNKDSESWVDLGPRRTITLTNLDPGRYEFVARGRNCQGVWTQTRVPLQIHVVPPFWMTTWFRMLTAGLLAGVVLVAHRVRLSTLERRNRELVSLHEQRERASRELELAYERLRTLARRLEAAKEEERKHIARELHDDLGPALTAVVINLQLLGQEKDQVRVARRLEDSIDLVDRMVQQIRDLSLDLRPPLMDEMGLVGALKGYLETQAERTGLHIEVRGDPVLEGLPPETEITVFRVAQEAVTNAIRHADPTRIAVTLRTGGGGLEIIVEDDGKGFDVRATLDGAATVKNLGLLGMQERARMIGGEMSIESAPGRGTQVRIRIPLEVAA
jgi:signal transduction histidine kinase/ligand-binding sensor domain-containing protein